MSLSKLQSRTNRLYFKRLRFNHQEPLSSMTEKGQCLNNAFRKRHLCASFSVEASVVMPVLICTLVFMMIFFRILAIQWGISAGSINLARKVAVCASGDVFDEVNERGGGSLGITGAAYGSIATESLPSKFIKNGLPGINLLDSKIDDRDIFIIATYKVPVTVGLFGRKSFDIVQNTKVRRWVGFDPKEEIEDGEYVYVTKSGVAYHKNINCVYLNPSIQMVSAENLADKRNDSGGKYHPCDRCKAKGRSSYYITDYGTVYHSTVSCSSLKRNIERIKYDEATGYHACGKCG